MNREKQLDRMELIVEAAKTIFRWAGYRRTQMEEITKKAGMGQGTIYNYFESKDALFDFLIRQQLLQIPRDGWPEAPIPTPPPGATISFLKKELKRIAILPSLSEAMKRTDCPDPRGELKTIINDFYDLISQHGVLVAMIESSAWEWPELEELHYKKVVSTWETLFRQYLGKRIKEQHFRPSSNIAASVRLLWESIIWFARDRPIYPYFKKINEKVAKNTVIEGLLHAFIADD